MMNEEQKYSAMDKMSDLICDNFSLLTMLSRFGLSLGVGDKTVREVCESQQVDCDTFLALANFASEGMTTYSSKEPNFSLPALTAYLRNAHAYFLDFSLPMIRGKLIEALDFSSMSNVSFLILKFFDDFYDVLRRHMEYENNTLFACVEDLLAGRRPKGHAITHLNGKHDQIDTKIRELKNIIIKYYQDKANGNLLNSVLFDIFNCEQDLEMHCQIEDFMFIPAVIRLEKEVHG